MPTDASRLKEARKQIEIVAEEAPAAHRAELDTARESVDAVIRWLEQGEVRADGGLSITPEELRRRKHAPSTTPDEERRRCVQCGSPKVRHHNDKWGTANGSWYCDVCNEHVQVEGPA